jgi:hypothetical protein
MGILRERDDSEASGFRLVDVRFGAELTRHPSHSLQRLHRIQRGFIDAGPAGSALAPEIRAVLDAEFVCEGDVILAMDRGSAPESVPRFFGCLDLVHAAPPLKAGSPGDNSAHRRAEAFENGFEIEPHRWSEPGRAPSSSSVARGYAR